METTLNLADAVEYTGSGAFTLSQVPVERVEGLEAFMSKVEEFENSSDVRHQLLLQQLRSFTTELMRVKTQVRTLNLIRLEKQYQEFVRYWSAQGFLSTEIDKMWFDQPKFSPNRKASYADSKVKS